MANISRKSCISKAILMYRIINNICPDYLKNYVSYTSDKYHVDILDILTVTNYKRQNLTANFSTSHSCTLELPSWILSPLHVKNATSVNTFKCLYLKWKRLNDHWIISNTTANLILYFVMIESMILYLYWSNQCILHVFYITCMIWYWCPCKCIVSYAMQQL